MSPRWPVNRYQRSQPTQKRRKRSNGLPGKLRKVKQIRHHPFGWCRILEQSSWRASLSAYIDALRKQSATEFTRYAGESLDLREKLLDIRVDNSSMELPARSPSL